MSIRKRIEEDIKTALRARDKQKTSVLRMLKAGLQAAEIALRSSQKPEVELDDQGAIRVIAAYGKQRRESIISYRDAGREELARKEEAELAVVRNYLPEQLDDGTIRIRVQEAVDATGATSVQDLGAVMQAAMASLRGAAEGRKVQRIARELLSGSD
ncbi:MAG: GatB/YqeY domain-containing protein [Acidobacteria bacterium]|nr:MAG: GatB/YqeY domain-containing protein [Acidobacteriota bacterium]TDI42859.1 MAG: GatB/YqeY domain-containing protein [Acidobacteriota bacterium]